MDIIRTAIEKPVAVTVGVIFVLLFGILSVTNIPVQLTPNVDSTVITVSTFWEGASPQEVEQEVIEKQEEKLKGVTGLQKMTSESRESEGSVKLEFYVGVDKDEALREVSDKLREVPSYPDNVDEPVISAVDEESRDYIAWIMFETSDPNLDIRTLQDFAEDRIKPRLERVEGIAEINVLGGREREIQVRIDPLRMAQMGVTYLDLANALRRENVNISAGSLPEGKADVRVRTVGKYQSVEEIEDTIITYTDGGPIRVGDVATAVATFKEPMSFVRSKGHATIALNADREVGSNVMQVMAGLKEAIDELNAPEGLLASHARKLGLDGTLFLEQVYDQTVYVDQAINLVTGNIFVGGALATIVLLLFLRSVRTVGIVALAIPVSIIGTFVAMVVMGRNLNVISLAGMAFAVGIVVDNAIVVLENIFRHLEMGERPARAALIGAKEVWGAVLASTLTTVAVFVPVLFIAEEAGQLFRDIALAICAAVLLSLMVSITVIPCAAAGLLNPRMVTHGKRGAATSTAAGRSATGTAILKPGWITRLLPSRLRPWRRLSSSPSPNDRPEVQSNSSSTGSGLPATLRGGGLSALLGRFVYHVNGSVIARVSIVGILAGIAVLGSGWLMPPTDYLPTGNRNIVFGMVITPPGYNLDKMAELGDRVEEEVRPFWEAGAYRDDPEAYAERVAELPRVMRFDPVTGEVSEVTPPTISNYFFVSFGGIVFHGAVSDDPARVSDVGALLTNASRQEQLPDTLGFAFQMPLFRLSGSTGSSISIEMVADDLQMLTDVADQVFMDFAMEFGFDKVQPKPFNFNLPGPELQIVLDRIRATDLGISTQDVGLAVRALSDGAIIGEYYGDGDTIDLTLIDQNAFNDRGQQVQRDLLRLNEVPIATPAGRVVPLGDVARLVRTTAPQQINRVEERRAVTIDYTPAPGIPLEQAMNDVRTRLAEMRESGILPPEVQTSIAGSADKLSAVRNAMLGDGTLLGLLSSRMFLALLITYLLMCVLFGSFLFPIAILLTVPLATFGGFVGLALVHGWSLRDPYMPVQNLDVLTMLGFVILIGIVVNNAILIVHQALNFMRSRAEIGEGTTTQMPPRAAIAEAVRTRVRPVLMSTSTSVGGMLPLVLPIGDLIPFLSMPASGAELYRGLGAVVVGGLLMATVFTLILVPMFFSLLLDLKIRIVGVTRAVEEHQGDFRVHGEPASSPASPAAPVPVAAPAASTSVAPSGRPAPRPA
ncbi:MAG: efflux RND transporter permease subunit [Planctomycetota bacterium]